MRAPGEPRPVDAERELGALQAILAASLADARSPYAVHPGDVAWWVHHVDPRTAGSMRYWIWDDRGWVAHDADEFGILAFAAPGVDIRPMVEWAWRTVGPRTPVGLVPRSRPELEALLTEHGFAPEDPGNPLFVRPTSPAPRVGLPPGWSIRPVRGEAEADQRRRASHAAFASTMDPRRHLDRYVRFMRSPAYVPEHDLVAAHASGRIGAFAIWWTDPSGIAEFEPVGTDPEFQRRGLGRAVLAEAFRRMAAEGMHTIRVTTDPWRADAVAFYHAVGFTQVGEARQWAPQTWGSGSTK